VRVFFYIANRLFLDFYLNVNTHVFFRKLFLFGLVGLVGLVVSSVLYRFGLKYYRNYDLEHASFSALKFGLFRVRFRME
jgi:uncharacterized membrane protein